MGVSFVRDLEACYRRLARALTSDAPVFVNRIGGSDTDLLLPYLKAKQEVGEAEALAGVRRGLATLKAYNGYYDKADSDDVLNGYCERMLDGYLRSREMMFVGGSLLTQFFPEHINPQFQVRDPAAFAAQRFLVDTLDAMGRDVAVYPYSFAEALLKGRWTLFRLFAEVLPGKRVLVVSPFQRSVEAQFPKRHSFFPNYTYPDFELLCYNTPITYSGLPDAFYPHANWHETADAMIADVAKLEFDVALLACGSYAVPLGGHIADEMQRRAIYVGGVLQLFLGVMGRRYENPFFKDQLASSVLVRPLEADRFLAYAHVERATAEEAFGAYF